MVVSINAMIQQTTGLIPKKHPKKEEFMAEVHCIGAPIFDACDNVTASIAISLPASRADGNQPGLVAKVKRMADAASRTLQILGYVSPAASSED